MGVQALQKYIESQIPGAFVPVDLLKIARTLIIKKPTCKLGPYSNKLFLLVDGESCLDRLYGGYYSDWVCGGQWNRMVQFLAVLIQTIQSNYVELAIYFNGSFEVHRMDEWSNLQQSKLRNINQVLKHISNKGTPPPKIWWVPPICLRTSLRMALRHLNVAVYCSINDHHKEIVNFCLNNNCHGLLAEDFEYAMFSPPRYFSSEQLKLTYKGSLETKEMNFDEVLRTIGLGIDKLCLLASLLGNHILSETDLEDFHNSLMSSCSALEADETLVHKIISFIKSLDDPINIINVGECIFTLPGDIRVQKLASCFQYYISGADRREAHFENVKQSLKHDPQLTLLPPHVNIVPSCLKKEDEYGQGDSQIGYCSAANGFTIPPDNMKTRTSYGNILPTLTAASNCYPDNMLPLCDNMAVKLPSVAPEIVRTAMDRHRKGLMSPWILQVLTQGQIKLSIGFESEKGPDTLNPSIIFRPIRQLVYGILFNIHHLTFVSNKSLGRVNVPKVQIKEWVYRKNNPYKEPDLVQADIMGWPAPTVQQLWFGNALDDKKRRLKAFLSCLRSDNPLVLSTSYVPQHLLVLACVLRFMMTKLMITRQELDAFLVQAMSPHLTEAQYLQELQLEMISPRGVQLASLFMTGVENALFANDACGAPIPWLMCCPWLFFDGKLFHYHLLKANASKNIMELCEGKMDLVGKIDRIRFAILDGLKVGRGIHINPPTCSNLYPFQPTFTMEHTLLPTGANVNNFCRRRDSRFVQTTMSGRGGQLEIAGVVVGNWGPNFNLMNDGRGNLTPQVTAVGGMRGQDLVKYHPRGAYNQKRDFKKQNKKRDNRHNLGKEPTDSRIENKPEAIMTMLTRDSQPEHPTRVEDKLDAGQSETSQAQLEDVTNEISEETSSS